MKRGALWKCHLFDTEREITCRRKYLFNHKPFYYVLSTLSDKKRFGGRSNTEINTFTMQITHQCVNAGRASQWVQACSDFLFSDLSFRISVLCLKCLLWLTWRDMDVMWMLGVSEWSVSSHLQSSQKRKVCKLGRQRDVLELRAEDENNG